MNVWDTCFFVPGFNRSECAAWVQAWGSIGAVLVAIFLPPWIERRRARVAAARAKRHAREFAECVTTEVGRLKAALPSVSKSDLAGIRTALNSFITQGEKLPTQDLVPAEIAAVVGLLKAGSELLEVLRQVEGQLSPPAIRLAVVQLESIEVHVGRHASVLLSEEGVAESFCSRR